MLPRPYCDEVNPMDSTILDSTGYLLRLRLVKSHSFLWKKNMSLRSIIQLTPELVIWAKTPFNHVRGGSGEKGKVDDENLEDPLFKQSSFILGGRVAKGSYM